ncbi:MAG: hypothetical protein HC896_01320 [Bacteroidales bacterium]|nr:hypothetical protein [Bacteroidales bacterium]
MRCFILYATQQQAEAIKPLIKGLTVMIVPDEVAWSYTFSETGSGIYALKKNTVLFVAPNSPADKANLKAGDFIVNIKGCSNVHALGELKGLKDFPTSLQFKSNYNSVTIEANIENEIINAGFKSFPVHNTCTDNEGNIWFGLWEGEIIKYNLSANAENSSKSWEKLTTTGYMPKIYQSRDGSVWIASMKTNTPVIQIKNGRKYFHKLYEQTADVSYQCDIIESDDNNLWITGLYSRIFRFNNGRWKLYPHTDIPLYSGVESKLFTYKTIDGALWFYNKGEVWRMEYNSGRWKTYNELNFQLESEPDNLWFISLDNKVVLKQNNKWQAFDESESIMNAPIKIFKHSSGLLWIIGSHNGIPTVSYRDGLSWKKKQFSMLETPVIDAYEDKQGQLWFVLGELNSFNKDGGLIKFSPSQGSIENNAAWTYFKPPSVPGKIRSIIQVSDSVYYLIGIKTYQFDGKRSWEVVGPKKLSETKSLSAYISPGNQVWIGTSEYGVYHKKDNTWELYSVVDGITGNDINCINGIDDNNIWVGTSRGLSYFDGDTWTRNFMGYTYPCNQIYIDTQESFWFNSQRPFQTVKFVPDTLPPDTKILDYSPKVSYFSNATFTWNGSDPWEINTRMNWFFPAG